MQRMPRTGYLLLSTLLPAIAWGTMPATAPEPEPLQGDPLTRMFHAATDTDRSFAETEDIVTITPEWLERRWIWCRKVANTQSLLAATARERQLAAEALLSRAQQIKGLLKSPPHPAPDETLTRTADYFLAEAQWIATGDPDPSIALTPAQQAAAQRLLTAARAARDSFFGTQKLRPNSPGSHRLALAWDRRILAAQLALRPSPQDRSTALTAYLQAAQEAEKSVQLLINFNATAVDLAEAQIAVIEADLLCLGPAAVSQRTPDYFAITARWVAAAEAWQEALRRIEVVRPRTPETRFEILHAARCLLDARMAKYPAGPERQNALDVYAASVRDLCKQVRSRQNIDGTAATGFMAQYALAESDYLVTTLQK